MKLNVKNMTTSALLLAVPTWLHVNIVPSTPEQSELQRRMKLYLLHRRRYYRMMARRKAR